MYRIKILFRLMAAIFCFRADNLALAGEAPGRGWRLSPLNNTGHRFCDFASGGSCRNAFVEGGLNEIRSLG